jgi:transcription elongation factor Elf1
MIVARIARVEDKLVVFFDCPNCGTQHYVCPPPLESVDGNCEQCGAEIVIEPVMGGNS